MVEIVSLEFELNNKIYMIVWVNHALVMVKVWYIERMTVFSLPLSLQINFEKEKNSRYYEGHKYLT